MAGVHGQRKGYARREWADGQKAKVRKQLPGSLRFTKADTVFLHFSLKSAYL